MRGRALIGLCLALAAGLLVVPDVSARAASSIVSVSSYNDLVAAVTAGFSSIKLNGDITDQTADDPPLVVPAYKMIQLNLNDHDVHITGHGAPGIQISEGATFRVAGKGCAPCPTMTVDVAGTSSEPAVEPTDGGRLIVQDNATLVATGGAGAAGQGGGAAIGGAGGVDGPGGDGGIVVVTGSAHLIATGGAGGIGAGGGAAIGGGGGAAGKAGGNGGRLEQWNAVLNAGGNPAPGVNVTGGIGDSNGATVGGGGGGARATGGAGGTAGIVDTADLTGGLTQGEGSAGGAAAELWAGASNEAELVADFAAGDPRVMALGYVGVESSSTSGPLKLRTDANTVFDLNSHTITSAGSENSGDAGLTLGTGSTLTITGSYDASGYASQFSAYGAPTSEDSARAGAGISLGSGSTLLITGQVIAQGRGGASTAPDAGSGAGIGGNGGLAGEDGSPGGSLRLDDGARLYAMGGQTSGAAVGAGAGIGGGGAGSSASGGAAGSFAIPSSTSTAWVDAIGGSGTEPGATVGSGGSASSAGTYGGVGTVPTPSITDVLGDASIPMKGGAVCLSGNFVGLGLQNSLTLHDEESGEDVTPVSYSEDNGQQLAVVLPPGTPGHHVDLTLTVAGNAATLDHTIQYSSAVSVTNWNSDSSGLANVLSSPGSAGITEVDIVGDVTVPAGSTAQFPASSSIETWSDWPLINEGFIGGAERIDGSGTVVNDGTIDAGIFVAPSVTVTGNNYLVSFDTQSSSGIVTRRVFAPTFGSGGYQYLLTSSPGRRGYVLAGWATTPDATTPDFDASTPIAGDRTLYAVWRPQPTQPVTQPSAPAGPMPLVTMPQSISIHGTPQVGRTLTVDTGSWTPSNVKLTYRWYADGRAITGAWHSTLVVPPKIFSRIVGSRITVRVTGSAPGYQTASTMSTRTAPVLAGTLSTKMPTIEGDTAVGSTLTVRTGTWAPGRVRLAYQWYADGKAIEHATGRTYTLVESQRGKRITVKVSGRHSGYLTAARISKATKEIS